MTATATLRQLRPGDVPAAVELSARCLPTSWTPAMLRDELALPGRRWVVAVEDDTLVGLAGAAVLAGELHVLSVAVDPAHRRRGLATALVGDLLTDAAQRGHRSATLEVREGARAARALYAGLGFVEEGRRPGYYRDEAAVIMWRREG